MRLLFNRGTESNLDALNMNLYRSNTTIITRLDRFAMSSIKLFAYGSRDSHPDADPSTYSAGLPV